MLRALSLFAIVLASAILVGASCSKKKAAPVAGPRSSPVPSRPPPTPEAPQAPGSGSASLTLTGALNTTVNGAVVTCGQTRLEGKNQGGTWQINTDDFMLQVVVLADADWAQPTVIVTTSQAKPAVYVFQPGNGSVNFGSDHTVTELDAELMNIEGVGSLHVKGRMTCPPRGP